MTGENEIKIYKGKQESRFDCEPQLSATGKETKDYTKESRVKNC